MYRQSRTEVASTGHQLWAALTALGAIMLWLAAKHLRSLPFALAGGLVMLVGLRQLRANRSRPIPEVTDGEFVTQNHHTQERVVSPPLPEDVQELAEEVESSDEVESVTVRPSPKGDEVIEVQLSGGRLSASLQRTFDEHDGDVKMRNPNSSDYYRLFVDV